MAKNITEPVRKSRVAEVGDRILWKKHNIEMEVAMVRENSVIARFLTFPVKGFEEEFQFDQTVINHRNYDILSK